MSDEWREAADQLSTAINNLYDTTGEYVDGWVLVTHKLSTEMEQNHQTAVGVVVKQGQSFVLSRGLLEVAADNIAFAGYEDDDD